MAEDETSSFAFCATTTTGSEVFLMNSIPSVCSQTKACNTILQIDLQVCDLVEHYNFDWDAFLV